MGRIIKRAYKKIKGIRRDVASYLLGESLRSIPYVYQLINIEPSLIEGYLQRSKGFSLLIDLGTKKTVENMNFSKDNNGVSKFTAVSAGNIYNIENWTGAVSSEAKVEDALDDDSYIDIIPCDDVTNGNVLVFLDGTGVPQMYDYTTVSNLFSDGSDFKSSFGKYINDRLWLNDVDEPALIKWSKSGDITNYTETDNAGFLRLGDDAEPLTACHEIFITGDRNTNILLAKENRLWGVSGKSGDSNDADRFMQYPINVGNVGTPSPRGLVGVGQDVVIMGKNDITQYGTVLRGDGTLKQTDIFMPIRGMYKDVTDAATTLDKAFIFYNQKDGRDGRVYSFLPEANVTKNNLSYVLDRSGGWYQRNWFQYSFASAAIDPATGKVYLGSYDGKIYLMDDGYSYAGDAYLSLLETGWNNFGKALDGKQANDKCKATLEVSSDTDIEFNYLKKYEKGPVVAGQETVSFSNFDARYNQDLYNEAYFNVGLSQTKELDISGVFDELSIQMKIRSDSVAFKFRDIILEAEVPNE